MHESLNIILQSQQECSKEHERRLLKKSNTFKCGGKICERMDGQTEKQTDRRLSGDLCTTLHRQVRQTFHHQSKLTLDIRVVIQEKNSKEFIVLTTDLQRLNCLISIHFVYLLNCSTYPSIRFKVDKKYIHPKQMLNTLPPEEHVSSPILCELYGITGII